MPKCQEHLNCDLVCSVCGSYYCRSDSHDSFHWVHVPWSKHRDLDTIDEEHDLGLRDLTDPFTQQPY